MCQGKGGGAGPGWQVGEREEGGPRGGRRDVGLASESRTHPAAWVSNLSLRPAPHQTPSPPPHAHLCPCALPPRAPSACPRVRSRPPSASPPARALARRRRPWWPDARGARRPACPRQTQAGSAGLRQGGGRVRGPGRRWGFRGASGAGGLQGPAADKQGGGIRWGGIRVRGRIQVGHKV